MCGISGFNWDDRNLIRKMTEIFSYRGPDSKGYYIDKNASLGHARLSIIDLSDKVKYPITNENKSIFLTFNGEIYNFQNLRKELEKTGHEFYTNTDAEVIVHAYEEYGEECVKKLQGMFAFAIWDSNKKTFFLARDRIGIKPLFYYFRDENFLFASEIKSILEFRDIKREMNYNALVNITDFLFPFNGETLFKNIFELLPGHSLTFDGSKSTIKKYWGINEEIDQSKPEEYYIKQLRKTLEESVKKRLISDVPLGATLSGGIDSSIIVSLMSKMSDIPVRTFTSGFGDPSDEFEFAKIISDEFGTEHKEIYIPFKNITKKVPDIVWHMETIITKTSTFPTYFFSNEIRKNITVALIGEGGDELFAGYPMYIPFTKNTKDFDFIYRKLPVSFFTEKDKVFRNIDIEGIREKETTHTENFFKNHDDTLNKVLLVDTKMQLPNVHLLRVDRMTMANSVEARVPFLDHNLVNLSFSMPSALKIKNGVQKYVLKKAFSSYVPKQIMQRKKVGLGTPISRWFEEDFSEIIPNILSEKNIMKREYMNNSYVRKLIKKRKMLSRFNPMFKRSGRVGNHLKSKYLGKMFFLSMLEIWYQIFIEERRKSKMF